MLNFHRTYTVPFKYNIPNYISIHLQKVKLYSRAFKFLRRYLYLIFLRQKNLEISRILPAHKKILWINVSAPSLGDSLMDLSSRRLLSGRTVDLYTDEKNYNLYLNDKYFNKIFTNCKDLYTREYDLVILDSFSSRTIKIKAKIAPKIIFVGMFGYFNGPEVNRILYSFHQMNYLLDYPMTEEEIIDNAKNSLSISRKDQEIVQNIIPKNYITISLGGEWKYKTYQKWKEVLNQLLLDNKNIKIIFVGSNNALIPSKQLLKSFPDDQLLNFTSLLSFNQTAEVIRKSEVFLCCDGGLMHAATALNAKIVALFARLTPEMLLSKNTNLYSLHDQENVNNIRPSKVISKYYEAINSADNHP
jgi:heptosyltransferase-2